jgi:predicted transcriptional regulator of viral defense system
MYLYRKVWCKPNLYKVYGISQILSHEEMAKTLDLRIEEIYASLRRIEEYGFISTIRSGQYFVRKYFTRENDERFIQTYDDFDI